jgi:SNF2 family DNA or RNA helicase
MRDTIEEKILDLQQKKFQLANKALNKADLIEMFQIKK